MKIAIGLASIFALLMTDARAADVTKVPAYDQFIVVPLRVHVLTSKELDLTDGRIAADEVEKAVLKINAIWSKAGIYFGLESIVREPAAQIGRFQALVQLNNGQFDDIGPFAYLLPTASRVFDGAHVYIFHDLPFNGGYLAGADATIVKEKPELNPVKGGSTDPLARVAARGLGVAVGLSARDDQFGLLSNGTNGVGLSEAEVGRARQLAKTLPGALEVDAAAKEAEAASKKGDVDKARRLWTWLSDIPAAGPAASEAKKKRLALPNPKPKSAPPKP